jgi:hypothetical protein
LPVFGLHVPGVPDVPALRGDASLLRCHRRCDILQVGSHALAHSDDLDFGKLHAVAFMDVCFKLRGCGSCWKQSSLASEGDTSEFAHHQTQREGEARRVERDYNPPTCRIAVARNARTLAAYSTAPRDAFVENSSPLDARHRFSHPACSLVFYGRWVTAGAYLLEAANPRHEHEWKIWKEAKLPEGKILIGEQGTLAVTGCSVAGRHRDATIPIHHSGLRATATS